MYSKSTPGRHRKAGSTRTVATRTAASAGAAVAAVLMSASGASAGTVAASAPTAEAPPLAISCTGYPIDAFTTCATAGHYGKGSDRGDASGGDTPSLGGGTPPAALVR